MCVWWWLDQIAHGDTWPLHVLPSCVWYELTFHSFLYVIPVNIPFLVLPLHPSLNSISAATLTSTFLGGVPEGPCISTTVDIKGKDNPTRSLCRLVRSTTISGGATQHVWLPYSRFSHSCMLYMLQCRISLDRFNGLMVLSDIMQVNRLCKERKKPKLVEPVMPELGSRFRSHLPSLL